MSQPPAHRPTIGIVGTWPPPLGGISVHIKRLAERLDERGFRVVILDTDPEAGKEIPFEHRAMPKGRHLSLAISAAVVELGIEVLHLHVFGAEWKLMLPFAMVQEVTGVPAVVTVHSLRRCASSMPTRSRRLFSLGARHIQHFLCAGPHVREHLLEFGVEPERATAFVPHLALPSESLVPRPFDPKLEDFLASHSPIISSGTGVLVAYDGRDLYGLDLFVRTAHVVRRQHPRIGFVFVMAGHCEPELVNDAEEFIADNDLEDTVLLWRRPIFPGTLLWQRSDIFVRATLSDGDAISLREALSSGVPSLASDAVARPPGCVTFRTGDMVDCAIQLLAMIDRLGQPQDHDAAAEPIPDGYSTVERVLLDAAATRRKMHLPLRVVRDGWTWMRS